MSWNSFYRNYGTKEDVLKHHVHALLESWNRAYQASGQDSDAALYGSLFGHLKEHSEFYLLLKKRNLFHLFEAVYLELFGPKPELDNIWAYTISFIVPGSLSWVEEWIVKGMQNRRGQ